MFNNKENINKYLRCFPVGYFNIKNESNLKEKEKYSLRIIRESINNYGFENLAITLNGGKDNMVAFYLFYEIWLEICADYNKFPICVYFKDKDSFEEINCFIKEITKQYNVVCVEKNGNPKKGLKELKKTHPSVKGIIMGTRRTDPYASNMLPFSSTTEGWPTYGLINPILDWSYQDIWKFTLGNGFHYCVLYELGYSSIGNKNDTSPNPYLKKDVSKNLLDSDNKYLPAWKLTDEKHERAGRISKK
jgi:FAD synthetase